MPTPSPCTDGIPNSRRVGGAVTAGKTIGLRELTKVRPIKGGVRELVFTRWYAISGRELKVLRVLLVHQDM